MWILLALISALLAATRRTSEKRLAGRLHAFSMDFMVQLMSLPVIGLALLLHRELLNRLHLGLHFWLPLLVVCIGFYPLNAYLYITAIKHEELSKVLPIQSLWPVLTLLPAWLTLGETPSVIATGGIILTVLGVYSLGLKNRALHNPLLPFRENKSSRYMLFGVMLVTVAGILDKIAIQASEAIYYSFVSTIGAVIVLGVVLKQQNISITGLLRSAPKELGLIGTLQGATYTTYLMAIGIGPIAYVTAIRSSNVLIGSVLGIILLNEKLTRQKILSFVLIATGAFLLAAR